ncbi:MAG: hypothetical protein KGM43_14845, partial [Planctomycetota bacterium]|nr:hypothetical protein [Planctomycetota bacterium]
MGELNASDLGSEGRAPAIDARAAEIRLVVVFFLVLPLVARLGPPRVMSSLAGHFRMVALHHTAAAAATDTPLGLVRLAVMR